VLALGAEGALAEGLDHLDVTAAFAHVGDGLAGDVKAASQLGAGDRSWGVEDGQDRFRGEACGEVRRREIDGGSLLWRGRELAEEALQRREASGAVEALTPPADGAVRAGAGFKDGGFSVLAVRAIHTRQWQKGGG